MVSNYESFDQTKDSRDSVRNVLSGGGAKGVGVWGHPPGKKSDF